jgi:hypothetical protein
MEYYRTPASPKLKSVPLDVHEIKSVSGSHQDVVWLTIVIEEVSHHRIHLGFRGHSVGAGTRVRSENSVLILRNRIAVAPLSCASGG